MIVIPCEPTVWNGENTMILNSRDKLAKGSVHVRLMGDNIEGMLSVKIIRCHDGKELSKKFHWWVEDTCDRRTGVVKPFRFECPMPLRVVEPGKKYSRGEIVSLTNGNFTARVLETDFEGGIVTLEKENIGTHNDFFGTYDAVSKRGGSGASIRVECDAYPFFSGMVVSAHCGVSTRTKYAVVKYTLMKRSGETEEVFSPKFRVCVTESAANANANVPLSQFRKNGELASHTGFDAPMELSNEWEAYSQGDTYSNTRQREDTSPAPPVEILPEPIRHHEEVISDGFELLSEGLLLSDSSMPPEISREMLYRNQELILMHLQTMSDQIRSMQRHHSPNY